MDLKDYKFKVGDIVITTTGDKGKIGYICECERCKERGFNEPHWVRDYDAELDYITKYDAQNNFPGFYQIGEYHFHPFNKNLVLEDIKGCEDYLEHLREKLKVIEEFENDSKGTED